MNQQQAASDARMDALEQVTEQTRSSIDMTASGLHLSKPYFKKSEHYQAELAAWRETVQAIAYTFRHGKPGFNQHEFLKKSGFYQD